MPMAVHLQRRSRYQQLASSTSKAPGRLLEEIPDFGLSKCYAGNCFERNILSMLAQRPMNTMNTRFTEHLPSNFYSNLRMYLTFTQHKSGENSKICKILRLSASSRRWRRRSQVRFQRDVQHVHVYIYIHTISVLCNYVYHVHSTIMDSLLVP